MACLSLVICGAVTPAKAATIVQGTLSTNTTWSPAQGAIIVISNLVVPAGVTLTVLPGSTIQVTNATSIRALHGGVIDIQGTAENKVFIRHTSGLTNGNWGGISAQFDSSITVRHADIQGGQVSVHSNSVGVVEDSFLHDYVLFSGGTTLTLPILLAQHAAPLIVRRTIFREYYEVLLRHGVHTLEDCVFEWIYGDGLDFDSALEGTMLRSCTFRHSVLANVDGIDIGIDGVNGCTNVQIRDCWIYDFPNDKGISIGDLGRSHGTVVSNCLISGCLAGIGNKDNCTTTVAQSTIVNCGAGISNYFRADPASPTGGGRITNSYNNILWNNGRAIHNLNGGELVARHSDFGGTNFAGPGMINANPLFVNPAGGDYRLQPASPCAGTGLGGTDMGAILPVGSPMASSNPRIESIVRQDNSAIVRFWADNERSYSVLCSEAVSGGAWTKVADVFPAVIPRRAAVTNSVPAAQSRFYRLVSPAQP